MRICGSRVNEDLLWLYVNKSEEAFEWLLETGGEAIEGHLFGGYYKDLVLTGAHDLANSIVVTNSATFSGTQNVTNNAKLTLSGTNQNGTTGTGYVTGADGTTVVYNGVETQGVFGTGTGSYGNLTITGSHSLANDITVTSTARV